MNYLQVLYCFSKYHSVHPGNITIGINCRPGTMSFSADGAVSLAHIVI